MNIFTRFKSLPLSARKSISLGLILALLIALPLFIWSIGNLKFDVRERAQNEIAVIDILNEPSIGYPDAPVTIVEFGDFECPFCKNFNDVTLSRILADYPNTVKFVFKDFPLATHPLARKAALAGQCALAQNKFWDMYHLIYDNQETLTTDSFSTFAETLSLNQTDFDSCLANETPIAEVDSDISEGQLLGVDSTPTFFINGRMVLGNQPYENFKTIIDEELVDDIVFVENQSIVLFTTTDQNPNVSINPGDLENGKTYTVNVDYKLQNNLKYNEASTSGIPVILLVDDVFKSSKDMPYSSIAGHANGASDSQITSFIANGNATNIKVEIDPNNIFAESNDTNNVYEINFVRGASSSASATATSTSSPLATATATATASPTDAGIGGPGEPNSCGGTCGSNYNCKANFFCYNGFCRNPVCADHSDCNCAVATATATSRSTTRPVGLTGTTKSSAKGSPKATPTYVSGISRLPSNNTDDNPVLEEIDTTEPENQFFTKYALFIFGGFTLLIIAIILYAVKRNRRSNIPHILPPTNI